MPEWNVPVPIDIPWQTPANGVHLWDVSSGHAWKFTYVVAQNPETGKWSTNLHDGRRDHEDAASAMREAKDHFNHCINRCIESRPLEEFLGTLIPSLDDKLGIFQGFKTAQVVKKLMDEAAGLASFSVRNLPWLMTREGNMMTRGGYEFPWPFTHLIVRHEDGWIHDGDPLRLTRIQSVLDAHKHFDASIEKLVIGPLEHQMREKLLDAAQEGPERLVEVFRSTYGISLDQPMPSL